MKAIVLSAGTLVPNFFAEPATQDCETPADAPYVTSQSSSGVSNSPPFETAPITGPRPPAAAGVALLKRDTTVAGLSVRSVGAATPIRRTWFDPRSASS